MDNARGTMKGALIGGIVGAAAALLLAPKSGRELRADLKNKVTDAQDRASRLIQDTGHRTQELAKQVGEQASNIADRARSAIAAVKDEAMNGKDDPVRDAKTN